MGYYIPGPVTGKSEDIVARHGGRVISREEAESLIGSPSEAVVAVKSNPVFEAAGLCYSEAEFREFSRPDDGRPTTFLAMPKAKAHELSNYTDTSAASRPSPA